MYSIEMETKIEVSDGGTFEINGIEFRAQFGWNGATEDIDIFIFGGYAQDEDGAWLEMDDFLVTTIDTGVEDNDGEVEITLTAADLKRAQEWRAIYPDEVPED